MNNALEMDKVATLSAQLLANLDEVVFFSRISGFVGELFEAHIKFRFSKRQLMARPD